MLPRNYACMLGAYRLSSCIGDTRNYCHRPYTPPCYKKNKVPVSYGKNAPAVNRALFDDSR